MTCPHASTTTVAWAFGEFDGSAAAEEAHTLHVASCDDCGKALQELEVVEAASAPLAGALPVDEPATAYVVAVPIPANTPRRGRLWGAVALAAALVLGTVAALVDDTLVETSAPVPVAVRIDPSPSPVPAPADAPLLDLDRELDALELELDALRTDPSIL